MRWDEAGVGALADIIKARDAEDAGAALDLLTDLMLAHGAEAYAWPAADRAKLGELRQRVYAILDRCMPDDLEDGA